MENDKIAVVYVQEVDNAKIFGKTKNISAEQIFSDQYKKYGCIAIFLDQYKMSLLCQFLDQSKNTHRCSRCSQHQGVIRQKPSTSHCFFCKQTNGCKQFLSSMKNLCCQHLNNSWFPSLEHCGEKSSVFRVTASLSPYYKATNQWCQLRNLPC